VLDLPMAEPPGTRFEYCNGASFLLSAVIQETTGMTAFAFAEANLFSPLGISDVVWPNNPRGITIGWGELRMRPHDMAKIGYLYLNEGRWDGEQILPPAWVAASTRKHIAATLQDGYGYQWWIADDGVYMAIGYAGQYIFVVPEHELIVALTSNMSENDISVPETLLRFLIIPAAKSSTPLPANPKGVDLLESRIQNAALAQNEPEPVPPLPEIAQRVTGQTYILDPNPLGWMSVSLTFQEGEEALMNVTLSPDYAPEIAVDPYFPSQVEWPVGLDNVYRFGPNDFGIPMGLKGGWMSEEDFIIDCDFVGNTGWCRMQFTFESDQLTLQIYGDRPLEKINGRLEK
jgi:hypothetical protein